MFDDTAFRFPSLTIPERNRQLSAEIILAAKRNDELLEYVRKRAEVHSENTQDAKAFLKAKEAWINHCLDYNKLCREELINLRKKGEIDFKEKESRLKEIEASDHGFLQELVTIKSRRTELAVGIRTESIVNVNIAQAYAELLSRLLPIPKNSSDSFSRDTSMQSNFKQLVVAKYSSHDTTTSGAYWCPSVNRNIYKADCKAAHIVPQTIPEPVFAHVFGIDVLDSYEAIWNENNALPMPSKYEEEFDRGGLIIIPDPQNPEEFITRIIDKSILNKVVVESMPGQPALGFPPTAGLTFRDIADTRLVFATSQRPSKRYLYFNMVMLLYRCKRCDVQNWPELWRDLPSGQIWGSPEAPYCQKGIIQEFAALIGDVADVKIMEETLGEGIGDLRTESSSADISDAEKDVFYDVTRLALENRVIWAGCTVDDDEKEFESENEEIEQK